MKFLRSQPSLWQKIKSACRLYFIDHKAKEAGAWGCQIPNKFLPMYIQGGTCSTLCDVSGAHADFGRHASAEKGFLGNSDAQAVGRFLKRNVVDTFSVRRVYDKVLYNRRADICAGNEPSENACILIWRLPRQRTVYCELTSRNTVLKEISTSEASVSVNDHRGVSVDRREERKRRRKASAVSGSLIILLE